MIDKENEIYTVVRKAILEKYPNANVSSMYVREPSTFPHVCIIQTDSYEPKKYIDSSLIEKYAVLAFQIDVYSDDEVHRKTECKEIMQIVDTTLKGMNFRREALAVVPNMADDTIYRLTGKYTVTVNADSFFGS